MRHVNVSHVLQLKIGFSYDEGVEREIERECVSVELFCRGWSAAHDGLPPWPVASARPVMES